MSTGYRRLYGAIAVASVVFCIIGHYLDAKSFWVNIIAGIPMTGIGILVGVRFVDRIASRIEQRERFVRHSQLYEGLSRLLTFVLEGTEGNMFHWSKHIQHTPPLREQLTLLADIQAQLRAKSYRLNVLQRKYVIEAAHDIRHALRSLSSLAFELSSQQGVVWLGICKSVEQLAELFPYPGDVPKDKEGRPEVDMSPQVVLFGADEFGLWFSELIDQMSEFSTAAPVDPEQRELPPHNRPLLPTDPDVGKLGAVSRSEAPNQSAPLCNVELQKTMAPEDA